MPTPGKNKNDMLDAANGITLSAASLIETVLRQGATANLEVRFGDCSLRLERGESDVRVLLEGATPILPRPKGLQDYLALLAFHRDLRQIAVIDTEARKIVTLLDHGAALERMYRSAGGAGGIWSGVQLVDRLSNQRIAPITFDLTLSADFLEMAQGSNVLMHLSEAARLMSRIRPLIFHLPETPKADGTHPEEDKAPAAGSSRQQPWSFGQAVKNVIAPAQQPSPPKRSSRPKTDAASDRDKQEVGGEESIEQQFDREDRVEAPPILRTSKRPFLTRTDVKHFIRAAVLVEEAEAHSIGTDDPSYAYSLQNFTGFPVSVALKMAVFEGAEPIILEATLEAEGRSDGSNQVRLVLPPMKAIEDAAFESLRAQITSQTGATVMYGKV